MRPWLMLRHRGAFWLAACGFPLLSLGVSLVVNVGPASWRALSMPLVRTLADDMLLYNAVFIIIAAPLAGVAAGSATRASHTTAVRVLPIVSPVLVAVMLFTVASALVTLSVRGTGATYLMARSHATMAVVALSLVSLGAVCGVAFADPLDAAGCGLILTWLEAGGLLVAGGWIELAPQWLTDLALKANPLVAMTAAAEIDLVRMDVLYRLSPLAHLQIEYPTWYWACAWYLALTLIGFLGVTWKYGRGRMIAARPHVERIAHDDT